VRGLSLIWRVLVFIVATLYCGTGAMLLALFYYPISRRRAMKLGQRILMRHWGRVICYSGRVRLTVIGERPEDKENYIVVPNHVSYLDIGVVPQLANVSFLSRHEVAYIPFLGWGATAVGVTYVNRKNERSRAKSREQLIERYHQGTHVALFAEGTTSDGTDVLPFKKAAFELGLDILPCAIKYRTPTGFNVGWYGDWGFIEHIKQLLEQPYVECRARIFPLMRAKDFPDFTAYQTAVRDKIRAWVVAPWGEEENPKS